MSSFFAGIRQTTEALTTARYGLQVTGENIANADTPGYTRQAARQAAVGSAVGVPRIHVGPGDGGGVRSLGAERLADQVLSRRVRSEHAKSADVDTRAARLTDIENIFHEPSDNGLSHQLQDFWSAWGDVANDPGAQVPREMLIASAESTVTMLHSMNASLDSVATAASASLEAAVTDVNIAASDLAGLNRRIAIGDATGADINTLLDQRDMLLEKLSTGIGATAMINANGTATVTVGGQTLVQGGSPPDETAGSLAVTYGSTPPDPPGGATITITDAAGAGPTTLLDPFVPTNLLTASAIHAEAQTLNDTVPKYRTALDKVAQELATTVNGAQSNGYTLDSANSYAGLDMFTGTTAATIEVAAGFGWKDVAASANTTTPPNLDASNALDAAALGGASGSPDEAYSSLVGELGRASASAQQQQATQTVITNSVDNLHATSAGVSFDEEVSNMLLYQKAFQASARVLSTMDSMLDTLINRTG